MNIYSAEYQQKLTTPQTAVEQIKNGDTIVHGMTIAEPPALLAAIADRARGGDLKDIKIFSFLPLEHAAKTVLAPDLSDCIQSYSWFVSGTDRAQVKVGLNYFVPNYLHQIPRLIRDFMEIDVTVTTVSPMDRAGYFSFGTANDYTSTAARHCKRLIVEVNENMPRVFGDSLLHISEVDTIVENHVPLMEMIPPELKPEDELIGKYLAMQYVNTHVDGSGIKVCSTLQQCLSGSFCAQYNRMGQLLTMMHIVHCGCSQVNH